jgi:glycosyltransferase involved in cell wall biosynthesis
MKVLHVIKIGGYGGAEKLLLQLLPALNKKIVADCLICCKKGQESPGRTIGDELEKKGVAVSYLFHKSVAGKNFLKGISQLVREGNYDLIHSHLTYANLWMAYLRWRRKINVPVITTLHGYRDSYQNKHGLLFKKKTVFTVYYRITSWIFKQLDGFIVISKCLQTFFRNSGLLKDDDMQVIYHGYEIMPGSDDTNRRAGLLNDPKIAIPGRLIKMKGHVFAINVLKQLIVTRPAAILHIYGDGPEDTSLRQIVKDQGLDRNIFFHGYVHNLLELLRQCDIVLIPSMYESFGLVFLDAFSAGVPVVAFDLPAGNEIVTHEYNGLLARPYDQESLYRQVVRLCESGDIRQTLVENATRELQTTFSIQRMANDYIQYYSDFAPGD